jgi:hypothetical protein
MTAETTAAQFAVTPPSGVSDVSARAICIVAAVAAGDARRS